MGGPRIQKTLKTGFQVNLLQEDVACSGRQAEAAQQSSDSWQQTVQHLQAELDRGEHAAEVDGMQAEVSFCCAPSVPWLK